jgi:phospholipase/carboxylesterase
MTLKFYTHPPKSGAKPSNIVFLLHGYGSNGHDLLGLAPYWAHILPETLFISPDAPFPCEMGPYGFQWFSLQSREPQNMHEGAKRAEPILNQFIDDILQQYGLTDDKVALVGFSQGTMMSLYAGPRRKNRIAGIMGYSGGLVGVETLSAPDVHRIPVHLIHGNEDTVLPLHYYHVARQGLEANGFPVTGTIHEGLPHSINDDGVEEGGAFLSRILNV